MLAVRAGAIVSQKRKGYENNFNGNVIVLCSTEQSASMENVGNSGMGSFFCV